MFKKILLGLGIAAAAGLVFALASLAQCNEEEDEDGYKGRELTELEIAELEED